jgi:glycosyltransferase involved in cell wall biosynthesis
VQPILSVIIPAYNVEQYIREAVDSALQQTFQDIEVIVIDDGSTDGTNSIVRSISDQRLVIMEQANGGLGAARNAGIRKAAGKYLGLLDGDDVWLPQKAEAHIPVMEKDENICISFSNMKYIDENGQYSGQLLISRYSEPTMDDLMLKNHITPTSAILRTSSIVEAGLFDEHIPGCEDYEMWVRMLHRTKMRAVHIPRVLAAYRVRGSSLSHDFDAHLMHADKAMGRVEAAIPEFAGDKRRRAYAEWCRVCSRKALSAGQIEVAWRLAAKALRAYPTLAVKDARAFGTLAILLAEKACPARWRGRAYLLARRLMRLFFRLGNGVFDRRGASGRA